MRAALNIFLFFVLFSLVFACENQKSDNTHYVYIASGSPKDSVGIAVFGWKAGELTPVGLIDVPASTSYLAVDTLNKRLYSVGDKISAFSVDKAGDLSLINQIEPNGEGACHVSISNDYRFLLVAYYRSGSASMYGLEENGGIGELVWSVQHHGSSVNKERQESAHAHMILPAPNSNLIIVPDLGIDKVMVYSSDSAGYVSEAPIPFANIRPGGGPRHAAFHSNGRFVYVLHELTGHVTGFSFDPKQGIVDSINTVPTLPEDFKDFNKSADIHITPNGQYLYASNRGHNSLAVMSVDQSTGALKYLGTQDCGGDWPRAFAVDPSGEYLLIANKRSNRISVMKINYKTGFFEKVSEVDTPLEPQGIRFMSMP
ncbi:lactonase family protein [Marinoscillum sp. MHG1-6]|uniref:lactonase family protein n=1 Tax=Marinoscillum sp. MHG1-6 TaxID=2959627 RepID=UPI0021582E25|nr:lactonase family protein [Marinoscillum sp. MHG1-6]